MTSHAEQRPGDHSSAGRARRLSDVVDRDAPLPGARAMALVAAVARTVEAMDPAAAPIRLDPSEVLLHDDGAVVVVAGAESVACADAADSELGASIGRMLFALLVGRAPLSRDEGYEPVLRAALPLTTCALVARSASDAPGQWPSPQEWVDELDRVAGAHTPPLPPVEQRRRRRRRTLLVAALLTLAAVSLAAALLAPTWWDDATDEGAVPAPSAVLAPSGQSERDSS